MFAYILIVIDCFTKKLWAEPIKKKTKEETADALDKVFSSMDTFPTMCVTDDGKGKNKYTTYTFKLFRIFQLECSSSNERLLYQPFFNTDKNSLESIDS